MLKSHRESYRAQGLYLLIGVLYRRTSSFDTCYSPSPPLCSIASIWLRMSVCVVVGTGPLIKSSEKLFLFYT